MIKKIILFLFLISLSCYGYWYYKNQSKEIVNPFEITLYGNIEIRQIDLSFQVAGKITALFKEEGDEVKKGDLLATLDELDYKANYVKAQADLERTSALKKDALQKYNRNRSLAKTGAVSKETLETSDNTKDRTEAEYQAAKAVLTLAQNQLDYTKLYAPDDGTITSRVLENGTNVTIGRVVYTMSKTKPIWVRAYINETDLGNIQYGQEVDVFTDTIDPNTYQNRQYKGKIGYISPVSEFTPKTVQSTDIRTSLVYKTRVYIDEPDPFLRQGMPVTLKIKLEHKQEQDQ